MIVIALNLHLFGGRGASVGISGKKATKANASAIPKVTKKTAKEINGMTRAQAVSAAKSIFVRNNMRNGLTKEEATRRFGLLIDGNSTAQLKKYIKRNQ